MSGIAFGQVRQNLGQVRAVPISDEIGDRKTPS